MSIKRVYAIWIVMTTCVYVNFGCGVKEVSPREFLGAWTALSKNHASISGDMVVSESSIHFAFSGKVTYQLIKKMDDHYILKLSQTVDSGPYMRLGPKKVTDSGEEIEVAYYRSIKDALEKSDDPIGKAHSWGIYIRN